MSMLLRSERGYSSRCHLVGDNFAVEDDDQSQRLLCVPGLQAIEPSRNFPAPFASCVIPSPRDGWQSPPMRGSSEEYAETARIVGFGGAGGSIGREE